MISSNNYHNYNSIKENTLPSPPIHQHIEHTMTKDQQKFCGAIIRNLKRHRDATPFLKPVDYAKLNVPDYPTIIKYPMDLCLVDSKLNALEYANVEEFIADVRLIFNNCFKYNGPEAMISVLCQNVESAFEKSLRQMPPNQVNMTSTVKHVHQKEPCSPPLSQHNSPPPPTPATPITPTTEEFARPKREIHCPSKDYPETFTTQRKLSHANKTSLQMKFCLQVLNELKKNKYRNQMYGFLKPVDPIELGLPDYTTIIKQPMDLSTIENKLLEDEYKNPIQFEQDVLLMFNNCYLYNPKTLPIYSMAQEMEKVFKDKWAQRPTNNTMMVVGSHSGVHSGSHSSKKRRGGSSRKKRSATNDNSSDDEINIIKDTDSQLAQLEKSIFNITRQIESIKYVKPKKSSRPAATKTMTESELATKKPLGRPVGTTNAAKRKRLGRLDDSDDDDDLYIFNFEEKKALSEEINNLSADRLNHVVTIIQNSMPNLGKNGQDEIELDIDALDLHTVHQLHNFVHPDIILKKKRSNKPKRIHYSEKDSDRVIQQLEQTLKKFVRLPPPGTHLEETNNNGGYEQDEDGSGSSDSDSD